MAVSRAEVQRIYTRRADEYARFVHAFRAPQGLRQLMRSSQLLRPGMRVLDAGCGAGMATFSLLDALHEEDFDYSLFHAFDLTSAMLERFGAGVQARGLARIELKQADVLKLDSLPCSWTNYDLIISASMLEYLSKADIAPALAGLRVRLAPHGRILVVITRKTPETKLFIEHLWHAERYTKRELHEAFHDAGYSSVLFRRFPHYYFWLNRANYVVVAAP